MVKNRCSTTLGFEALSITKYFYTGILTLGTLPWSWRFIVTYFYWCLSFSSSSYSILFILYLPSISVCINLWLRLFLGIILGLEVFLLVFTQVFPFSPYAFNLLENSGE